MTPVRTALGLLAALSLLQGCKSGGSSLVTPGTTDTAGDSAGGTGTTTPGTTEDDIEDEQDVEDLCEEAVPETYTAVVRFEALSGGCPFGEGGNLEAEQGVMTARIEQTVPIDLPETAVICDVAFDFQAVSGGEGTPMVYDDNFIFTFNDVILAASYGPLIETLPTSDELVYRYDWSEVRGYEVSFDPGIPTYCLGEAEGYSECTIPPPETRGLMALQYEGVIASRLALQAIRQDRYDLTFITLGDNDSSDCSHEEFAFEVEIPYVAL